MWVHHRKVGWRYGQVHVGDGDEHRAVDSWIASVCTHVRLDRHARIARHVGKRGISGIELRYPQDILWSGGVSRGDVTVVWPNSHAGVLPLKVHLAAWEA